MAFQKIIFNFYTNLSLYYLRNFRCYFQEMSLILNCLGSREDSLPSLKDTNFAFYKEPIYCR